jgi:hypothetical protein
MSRRTLAAMAILALSAPLAFASDAVDRVCVRAGSPLRFDLAAMFDHAIEEPVETGAGVSTTGPLELLVVRLGEDGKPVAVCVDNEAAAQKFLDAPVERIQSKKAKEH